MVSAREAGLSPEGQWCTFRDVPSVRLITVTALAPALWGGTYVLFTETLPTSHPLWVGTLRALPAGLLLMLWVGAPPRRAWARLAALGVANSGLFSALLFVSASRLQAWLAALRVQHHRQHVKGRARKLVIDERVYWFSVRHLHASTVPPAATPLTADVESA